MSLISIKNFISPFTNTVHAVTILLVTVLFAVFRLQGGGVAVSFNKARDSQVIDRRSDAPAKQVNLDSLIEREPAEQAPAKVAPRALPQKGTIEITREDDDLIRQMMGKSSAESNNAARQPSKPASNRDLGGLDEIEKTLGMR